VSSVPTWPGAHASSGRPLTTPRVAVLNRKWCDGTQGGTIGEGTSCAAM
jgi:hypothetical protein